MPTNHRLKVRMFDKGLVQQAVADDWGRSLTYVSRRFTYKEPFNEQELAYLVKELGIESAEEMVALIYPSISMLFTKGG